MEIEYEDEEVVQTKDNKLKIEKAPQIDDKNLDNYITDTKNYDPTKFNIISPEETVIEYEKDQINNPNPEFSLAIKELEGITKRPLTKEEYIKAANTYATILTERDEEKKKNYEGKYEINPIKKDIYLDLILNNKPVSTAFEQSMKEYENNMIAPLMKSFEEARQNELKVLELKKKARVNLRYKGKCRIAADEGGKVIIIDNKNDVDLLRMKYRKAWIEKRFPEKIKGKQESNSLDDDEFE
jgi:hypothetical protein